MWKDMTLGIPLLNVISPRYTCPYVDKYHVALKESQLNILFFSYLPDNTNLKPKYTQSTQSYPSTSAFTLAIFQAGGSSITALFCSCYLMNRDSHISLPILVCPLCHKFPQL